MDRYVPELPARPLGAPQEHAVRDHAAPYPRTQRDEDEVSPASLPAPNRNSPHAAAFASFSTVVDSPVLSSSSSFKGTPSMACRLGADDYLVLRRRDGPGTARHVPPTSNPSLTSLMARAIVSTSLSGGPATGT